MAHRGCVSGGWGCRVRGWLGGGGAPSPVAVSLPYLLHTLCRAGFLPHNSGQWSLGGGGRRREAGTRGWSGGRRRRRREGELEAGRARGPTDAGCAGAAAWDSELSPARAWGL